MQLLTTLTTSTRRLSTSQVSSASAIFHSPAYPDYLYTHWGPVVVRPKCKCVKYNTHTHTSPFNSPLSGMTRLSRYQKGKTNLDFTEARDSEWQWLQLGHMQVCTLLQTDNHTSTPPLSFLQAGCPSCHPTNSVKALKINVYLSQVTTTTSATAATPV